MKGCSSCNLMFSRNLMFSQNPNFKILIGVQFFQVQFSSVTQSCLTLYDPMNRSTPGLSVHDQLPESTQTHVN